MFGTRLKALREEKEKTQEEIANILGISRQAYSKYELDLAKPDFNIINKIADYFDVPTDFLFGRTNLKTSDDYYYFYNFRLSYIKKNVSNELIDVVDSFCSLVEKMHPSKLSFLNELLRVFNRMP